MTTMLILLFSLIAFPVTQEKEKTFTSVEEFIHQSERSQLQPAILFTGSDWCKPCILLEKEVLQRRDFTEVIADHILLYRADFPYHAKNKLPKVTENFNRLVADMYNEDGIFPLLVILDKEQEVMAKIGYAPSKGPDHFITTLKAALQ